MEEEPLVFETPFELNSTQVMFVANEAAFLDEEAAKAALQPVAEVILSLIHIFCLSIYNAYGEQMHRYTLKADQGGRASTLDLELPASTTYYIYIWANGGDTISYSLIIRDPEEQKSGYSTAESVAESVGAVAGQEISAGTNQDDGGMIPLETKLSGKVSDGQGQWYAFTTNSVENATYDVTTVNETPGSGIFCPVSYTHLDV